MNLACLFGHRWEGCVCRRCGAKAHEHSDRHMWECIGTVEREDHFSSSRGSGQYLDPYYGSPDAPSANIQEYYTYICQTCGMKKTTFFKL